MKIIYKNLIVIGLIITSYSLNAQTNFKENTSSKNSSESEKSNDLSSGLSGFSADDLLVVVYDMLGREIYSKVEVNEKDGFLFTNVSNGNKLPSGVYLITASANDNIFRQKLIVK
ncbi:MAG: hypothetical protein K0S44_2428 [Bacteroidetes bacterium]|jgi:hypothetical protein|nr:hypothetical protein [Bacteroidota bacterium]